MKSSCCLQDIVLGFLVGSLSNGDIVDTEEVLKSTRPKLVELLSMKAM